MIDMYEKMYNREGSTGEGMRSRTLAFAGNLLAHLIRRSVE